MNGRMLNRREFNRLCAALGMALPTVSTMILRPLFGQSAGPVVALNDVRRTVKFHDGTIVPALGQGSWHLAQGRHPEAAEEDALRTGLSLGMTLIDTAEMYSDGRSEELVGRVIGGQRDQRIPGLQSAAQSYNGRRHSACLRGQPCPSRH